ncbi:MAG: 3-oxoadipate enol-lactonase [Candidatus Acidiferrales bacterium]
MPFIQANGAQIEYQFDGPAAAPVLLLSNSLGTNFSLWDPQIRAFSSSFRVLRYNTRGHVQSSLTPGPYSMDQLGRDVLSLLEALAIDRAHFCGLSVGGMIGMSAALQAPGRFRTLIVSNTAGKIGNLDVWAARIAKVREAGMASVASAVVERWFTPEFVERDPRTVDSTRQMLLAIPPEGYAACCAALRDADLRDAIAGIALRTLVIAGARDPVIPLPDARLIADRIPAARFLELNAAHLSNIEDAAGFNSAVLEFLSASEAA